MNAKTKLKGVNKMQMPGFTAGASLYKSEGYYYMQSASNQGRAAILPAADSHCFSNCVAYACSDLDGLDALNCRKECSRTCRPLQGRNFPTAGPCFDPFWICMAGCVLSSLVLASPSVACVDGCIATADICAVKNP